MKLEITRRTVLTIVLTLAITVLTVGMVWLYISVRNFSSENVALKNRVSELETRVQEQANTLATKDSEIAQLSETKITLSKSVEQLQAEKPQKEAVAEALSALRKVEAAMKVGSDMFNFNRLLTEAQAKVTEASNILPKGKLRINLEAAISNYENAINALRSKIMERDDYMKDAYQGQVNYYATEAGKNIKAASGLQGPPFAKVEEK